MKIIIAIIIVVLVIIFIGTNKSDNPTPNEVVEQAEEQGGASGQFAKLASDAIVVMDQRPGDIVIASAVNLSKGGFIVVKKDKEGKAGDIIGVSEFLTPGAHSNIDIGTTESLLDGLVYYAELFSDDGDGIFDPKNDKHVRWNNEDMFAVFNIDKDAPDPQKVEINY